MIKITKSKSTFEKAFSEARSQNFCSLILLTNFARFFQKRFSKSGNATLLAPPLKKVDFKSYFFKSKLYNE
jgi:hypothetical protein